MDERTPAPTPKGRNLLRDAFTVLLEEATLQHEAIALTLKRIGEITEHEIIAAGESVARICEASARHAEEVEALRRDESRAKSGAFAAELSRVLVGVPSMIRRMMVQAEAQAENAGKAQEHVVNIRGLLDTIDRIAADCRLIAANARIEAADAGAKGEGFAAVAHDLKDVARDAQNAARSIETLGQATVRILLGMASKAKRIVQDGNLEMETLATAAAQCRQAYADAVIGTLGTLRAHAEQIRDQSNRTIGHLQFQDRIQQALEHAKRQSAGMVTILRRLVAEVAAGNDHGLDAAALRQMVRAARAPMAPMSAVSAPGGDGTVEFL